MTSTASMGGWLDDMPAPVPLRPDGAPVGPSPRANSHSRCVNMVVTFEQLPREYLRPLEAPPRITTLRDKWPLLESCAVDRVLCLPFNERLRQLSARDFVEQVFVEGLGVRYLAFGDDFRFFVPVY